MTTEEQLLTTILKKAQDIANRVDELENKAEELADRDLPLTDKEEEEIVEIVENAINDRDLASQSYVDDAIEEAKDGFNMDELLDGSLSGYLTKEDFKEQLKELRSETADQIRGAAQTLVDEVKKLTGLIISPTSLERLNLVKSIEGGLKELTDVQKMVDKVDSMAKNQVSMKKSIDTLKSVFAYAGKVFKEEEFGE